MASSWAWARAVRRAAIGWRSKSKEAERPKDYDAKALNASCKHHSYLVYKGNPLHQLPESAMNKGQDPGTGKGQQ